MFQRKAEFKFLAEKFAMHRVGSTLGFQSFQFEPFTEMLRFHDDIDAVLSYEFPVCKP